MKLVFQEWIGLLDRVHSRGNELEQTIASWDRCRPAQSRLSPLLSVPRVGSSEERRPGQSRCRSYDGPPIESERWHEPQGTGICIPRNGRAGQGNGRLPSSHSARSERCYCLRMAGVHLLAQRSTSIKPSQTTPWQSAPNRTCSTSTHGGGLPTCAKAISSEH